MWLKLFRVLAIVLLVLQALTASLAALADSAVLPKQFGNKTATQHSVKSRPNGSYRFGVLGDVQSSDTGFEMLQELTLKPLDMVVLTGDVLRSGKPGYHAILKTEIERIAPLPMPIFYVMGNRDVKQGLFEIKDFETAYGPSNFWFSHGGDLFIMTRFADPSWPSEASVEFLQTVLKEQRSKHRWAFVFSHVPPRFLEELGSHALPMTVTEPVMQACEKYQVSYFFSGHHHLFRKQTVGSTTYVISGGGGGTLHEKEAFFHSLVVKVSEGSVEEEIVRGKSQWNIYSSLKGVLVGEVWLRMTQRLWLTAAVQVLLFLFLWFSRPAYRTMRTN